MSTVKPIPDGFHAATPYLCVKGGAEALDFYAKAFGGVEKSRMADPSGRIGHAEIWIGEAPIFLSDEHPEMGILGPKTLGGTSVGIHLYVEDVDAFTARAVAAGAKALRPVEDQFYGDRAGTLEDPFGHRWYVSTHKEDVSPDEMKRRAEKLYGAG